jgi:hypothetical protein
MLRLRTNYITPATRTIAPREFVRSLTSLVSPIAFTAYVMAAWRLGADMNWLGEFVISQGLLSRWQVWLALAVAAQICAQQLSRAWNTDAAPGKGA